MINLQTATRHELVDCIAYYFENDATALFERAFNIRQDKFGNRVFVRGLIEISSYCKNNCYYCGIRAQNKNAIRYRLYKEEILSCCENGYALGFRTFVLQGGEDAYFTDEKLCDIVEKIRKKFPDAAITLSLGERSNASYKRLFQSGANRYLLRHEAANKTCYAALHPENMRLSDRKNCLTNLKEIGFQTGAGFMVGSPGQTIEHLADDLIFLRELDPQMVGIGPFIPHQHTPFAEYPPGKLHHTLVMLALTRILLPHVLLPATTALGSISDQGRELGLFAGANVVMPNLSPVEHRPDYMLYNGKISTGVESAEGLSLLNKRFTHYGFQVDMSRGDYKKCLN